MTTATYSFDCEPIAARRARRFVREWLGEEHPRLHDAEFVVSELVGNVVRHTPRGGALRLAFTEQDVDLSVVDYGGQTVPHVCEDPDDLGGRGLMAIDVLAKEWGHRRLEPAEEVYVEEPCGEDACAKEPYVQEVWVKLHGPSLRPEV